MTNKKYKALSLFSGIGGFEVGMDSLGFEFLNTLEWDKKSCETLKANLGKYVKSEIKPIDITKTKPSEFWQGTETIDYIVGGPPCQSFSAAGRRAGGVRGINDTRGSLFWYYCKYVKHFSPKAFVFENVRGILSSKKGEDFKIICDSFTEIGYDLYWRVLNAADYGVPQMRERIFLVGIRKDLKIEFKFPKPTFGPDSSDRKPYRTVGEAISDLYDPTEIVPPYGGKYGHLIPEIPEGENYRYFTEEMGHKKPLFAWRSKFSGFLQKVARDDVCKTIVAYQSRYDGPFHWANRKCTVNELKRLQGFPDHFVINQSYGAAVKQIGNSVCPPVARQIGKALLMQLEGKKFEDLELLSPEEKLSFDKHKREKSVISKKKIKVRYNELRQQSLFEEEDKEFENAIADYKEQRQVDNYKVESVFKNNQLKIKVTDKEYLSSNEMIRIKLDFIGAISRTIKSAIVTARCSQGDHSILKRMWLELHQWINQYTSYESLLPLYGHFTEPYPKFQIHYDNHMLTAESYFQEIAVKSATLNQLVSYDILERKYGDTGQLLKSMREYGFDVRTNNTNRTIPEGYFRICYPFVLPTAFVSSNNWAEKFGEKSTDFDISCLKG